MFVRRTRTTALAALALLNVFTLTAGLVVAHMLPTRLARLRIPVAATRAVVNATPVLAPVGTPATRVQATAPPTASGLASMLAAALPAAATGPGVGIEIADAGSGQVLYSADAGTPATPASTTKVVTAVAALAALGPGARFSTAVRQVGDTVVLAGGGDPTLAVNEYPSSDYPRPATLAQLAAGTARGVVRAKTGNLATVATLAGLAYDHAGDLLLFAIMAPRVPGADRLPLAANAIDAAAAGLAGCGCS